MGIYSFIRSMFDTKYNCDYFIKSTEISFQNHKKTFPGYDPHFYLAQAWMAYMSLHGANPDDPDLQVAALPTTYLVACVPPPICARALGLFLLFRDRPREFTKYKTFQEEFGRIMLPVFEAQENGTIEQLYKKYNPKMADQMSPPQKAEVNSSEAEKSSKQAKRYIVSDEENEEADRTIRECLRKMNNANKS